MASSDVKKDVYERFVNLSVISIAVATLIFTLLLIFIFEPNIHNPPWVIIGTYLWVLLFVVFIFNRISPPYLKVKKGELIFIGFPWIYKIRREWLDKVLIEPTGIIFEPKEEYVNKFRWVPKVPGETYQNYKIIKFANYRAIGAIIEAMQPITGVVIDWDKISPKWREYLREKLYGE